MSHGLFWPGRAGPGLGSRAMSKSEESPREWTECERTEGGREGGCRRKGQVHVGSCLLPGRPFPAPQLLRWAAQPGLLWTLSPPTQGWTQVPEGPSSSSEDHGTEINPPSLPPLL